MELTREDARLFWNWLSKQPRTKTFSYNSPTDCLIANYLKACGFSYVSVGEAEFSVTGRGRDEQLPEVLDDIARLGKKWDRRWWPDTYGAAADYTEKVFLAKYGMNWLYETFGASDGN